VSSHPSSDGVVALAFADEVIESPELLGPLARAIGADEGITLVLFGTDVEATELAASLGPAVAQVGLDSEDALELIALAVPSTLESLDRVREQVDCIFTARRPQAPFDTLPVVSPWAPRALRELRQPVTFRCNCCGVGSRTPLADLRREGGSCPGCHSTPRWRSVVHALSLTLFGESLALADFPFRRDIRGVGLTDWDGYAYGLRERLGYLNTYYHAEPRLDIAHPDPALLGSLDFIIASDVFEHVEPPVVEGLASARRLLRPGGALIVTVPYTRGPDTIEHFPELHDWQVVEEAGDHVLHNITADGRRQRFDDLVFHGGAGTTLEMRLFSLAGLVRSLEEAGFDQVSPLEDPYDPFGIRMGPGGGGGWPVVARVAA
jgi:SAM-dependent methyltransferase